MKTIRIRLAKIGPAAMTAHQARGLGKSLERGLAARLAAGAETARPASHVESPAVRTLATAIYRKIDP